MESNMTAQSGELREMEKHWNGALIAGSVAISFLGAFTSTQLMSQARLSRYLSGVLIWITLSSVTFGFCSIWCFHFVAMLACELDVKIGLDPFLTILSAFLAVFFTFVTLASEQVLDRYKGLKRRRKRKTSGRKREERIGLLDVVSSEQGESTEGLLSATRVNSIQSQEADYSGINSPDPEAPQAQNFGNYITGARTKKPSSMIPAFRSDIQFGSSILQSAENTSPIRKYPSHDVQVPTDFAEDTREEMDYDETNISEGVSSEYSSSRRSSAAANSDSSTLGLKGFSSIRLVQHGTFGGNNPFKATAVTLWKGCTSHTVGKGFFWSVAIFSMHYVGLGALRIPQGYWTVQPGLVILSALIGWVVCTTGFILMGKMETQLPQQLLFSIFSTLGVAAKHFTGMAAATFWTREPPQDSRGYPYGLPIAIGSIAIITCLAANGLLAHSATIARNKLAEIVQTRKKLWAAIAQKENAEAAALARSEFIASASHEIRTPLHQLQGYSDLLFRTELTEEGRLLLYAIQDATRTLSLITSNVLDWSRLEKGEAVCRPTALNVRAVCESVINLLPNKDEDADVELLVVVSPKIPHSLFLDETYLHRIVMNLVSNALKFTLSGYVMLRLEMKESNGNNLIISVTDTGCGIPKSFIPQLFEPFKQAQIRGAHRGTGLGLSIVKQLLQKMDGTIESESRFQDDEGVESDTSGSKFTVTIPIQPDIPSPGWQAPSGIRLKLAVFMDHNERLIEGLQTAWEAFGIEAVPVKEFSELSPLFKYIWVEATYLRRHQPLLGQLANQTQWLVLVPYDTENTLHEILGSRPASPFLPIQRPLVWHQIMESIASAGQRRTAKADEGGKLVRFASYVDVVNAVGKDGDQTETMSKKTTSTSTLVDSESRPLTIMLVEDNKINQKLGAKMLRTLGYEVILANDGQEAIDLLVEYDSTVDVVLMDQSMPRKDGLTATREIREMEENGTLKGPGLRGPRRPIIAVTAVVGPTAEAMCRDAGTDTFLAKPLSLARLRDTLEAILKPKNATGNNEEGLVIGNGIAEETSQH